MTENRATHNRRYVIAFALLVAFVAGLWTSEAIAKKICVGVSVTVRYNSHGKKVDLAHAPEYKDAVHTFMDKKYADALVKFQSLDKNGYCCDMVHYYIAQCYQYTNQVRPAMLHYEWVDTYSKDPRLKYYADGAYQQLAYYNEHRTYAGQGNNFNRAVFQSAMRSSGTFSRG
ncbi:MAG TPA: hypothetical protein V6C69_01355 [Trichormus sp.]|jgi:hypothetical protein